MSNLKINDLQSAQTEGYISELTETEMTVWGGSLVSTGDILSNNDVLSNNDEIEINAFGVQLIGVPVA